MENKDQAKLDWMYKSATSLVNREEYLLGRTVDKTLEQLNAEEKTKIVLPTPKNHVEHECIPPSIRDFNKIVHAEQVDLSAKLQEDPLVAIKKREEEARRQFLQNPVQLKKLQEALKAQQDQKVKRHKRKMKKSKDSDLDRKIKEKLRLLKGSNLDISNRKKSNSEALDTILMHKYNALKDKLSDKDLDDILRGNISDSEDENSKKMQDSSSSDNSKEESTGKGKRKYSNEKEKTKKHKKSHKREKSSSSDSEDERRKFKGKDKKRQDRNKSKKHKYAEKGSTVKTQDKDLDRKIMEKLKMLRGEGERQQKVNKEERINPKDARPQLHRKRTSSSSSSSSSTGSSDEPRNKKTFGLVSSTGKKILLNKNVTHLPAPTKELPKIEPPPKVVRNKVTKLSEEEKEKLRQEMMQNAEKRDKEREEKVRKHRAKTEKEEEMNKNYDAEFVHKALVKSTQHATVESRIKSNLNNIQRSSMSMNKNFSRR